MADVGRLQGFINIASAPEAGEHDAIKLGGDGGLKLTGRGGAFFTFASTHRDTIKDFIAAMRERYGDHIADMASNRLADELAAGKPLRAYQVREMEAMAKWDEINRAHNANHNANRLLIIDLVTDRETLENFRHLCEAGGVTQEDSQSALYDRVMHHLRTRADTSGFDALRLTKDGLKAGIASRNPAFVGEHFAKALEILGEKNAGLPGSPVDKLRLVDLGIGRKIPGSLYQAVLHLPAMREMQGEGELEPDTVWNTLLPSVKRKAAEPFGETLDVRVNTSVSGAVNMVRNAHSPTESAGVRVKADQSAIFYVRYKRIMEMAGRAETISLADAPNVGGGISRPASLAAAERSLRADLARRGSSRPGKLAAETAPPPTVVAFNFGGEIPPKTITVGSQAVRGGADELDELMANSRAVCGEGASEAQIAGVISCLGDGALTPLRELAPLIGVDFGDSPNVSVRLTRQAGGAVLAEFSTPEEMNNDVGRFGMRVEIGKKGEMLVRSFELAPSNRALVRRQMDDLLGRSFNRQSDSNGRAGFAERVRRLAERRGHRIDKVHNSLIGLVEAPARSRAAGESAKLGRALTREECAGIIDGEIDKILDSAGATANLLTPLDTPPDRNRIFLAALGRRIAITDRKAVRTAMDMARSAAVAMKEILSAGDGGQILQALGSLGAAMENELKNAGLTPGEADNARALAWSMAIEEVAGAAGAESIERSLATFGSRLWDAGHAANAMANAAKAGGEPVPPAAVAYQSLIRAFEDKLPEEDVKGLRMENIGERDLSIARQRELLGLERGDVQIQGAAVAGLGDREAAAAELSRMEAAFKSEVVDLASVRLFGDNGAIPDDPKSAEWKMYRVFEADYNRNGITIDGRHYHPNITGTSLEEIVDMFPDRRTAAIISTVAFQRLQTHFPSGFNNLLSDIMRSADDVRKDPRPVASPGTANIRIETLDAKAGRYRITGASAVLPGIYNPDVKGSPEHMIYATSVEISVLGLPPTVHDVAMDFIVRGRAATPEEALAEDSRPAANAV